MHKNIISMIKSKKGLYGILSKCYNTPKILLYYILGLLFRIESKAVFCSFNGKSYSCNPRAISEELHKQNPEIEIVWAFLDVEKKRNVVPEYVRCIKHGSLREIYELATAKYWIDNFNKPITTRKRKGQLYIQTWHGDRGFKKVLYDSPNCKFSDKYIEQHICDIMTVGSDFGIKKIRGAFKYHGELLKNGSPRNDKLVCISTDEIDKIKASLGIASNKKVVLFAPTFRRSSGNNKQSMQGLDLLGIKDKLDEITGQEWVCLTRAHIISNGLEIESSAMNHVIDVTKYEDMADLLLITDLFITDYSSSAGDFILKRKPLILFQPDREEYMTNDRSFYFDIDKSPFIVAKNQNELIDILSDLTEEKARKNCEDIIKFYGVFESGQAAKKVVEYMHAFDKKEDYNEEV